MAVRRKTKKPRKQQLRFTGEWPPPELWAEYPNWRNVIEEEGVPGQDETTLGPAERQDLIGEDVDLTAGVVQLADGTEHRAIVELSFQAVNGLNVMVAPQRGWRLFLRGGVRWEVFDDSYREAEDRGPVVKMDDPRFFPLQVRTVLPLEKTGQPVRFEILADGATRGSRGVKFVLAELRNRLGG